MRGIFKISIISAAFVISPLFCSAQTSDSLLLEVSPLLPQEGEQYTVKLNTYNVQQSSIQWLIDGSENTAAYNSNTITLTAMDVGNPTKVTAKVTRFDGSVIQASRTIYPTRIDLIVEADTVVPPFYNGRRLPSSGGSVSATALVFTQEKLPIKSYSYVWKINGTVQNGGPLKGKNTLSFTPSFGYETILSVDVLNQDGKTIARETKVIPIVEPELYFYEKNPLRGLSFVALADPHPFIGEETTIRAEGYFMSPDLFGSNVFREWSINGKPVQKETDLAEISIQKQGNSGSAVLSFHIRNLAQLLQGVEKTISLKF